MRRASSAAAQALITLVDCNTLMDDIPLEGIGVADEQVRIHNRLVHDARMFNSDRPDLSCVSERVSEVHKTPPPSLSTTKRVHDLES